MTDSGVYIELHALLIGAPQTILELIHQRNPNLSEKTMRTYNNEVAEFARRGFRSLGAA